MSKFLSSALALAVSAVIAAVSSVSVCAANLSASAPAVQSVKSNFSENAYNHGDNLDKNNTAVYNAFKKLTEPNLKQFTVTLPEPVKITLSSYPGDFSDKDSAAFQQAIFENCKPGIDSVLWDMPEIIWLDPANMQIGLGEYEIGGYNIFRGEYTLIVYQITFTPVLASGYSSAAEVNEYREKLQTAVDEFPIEGETRYEQLKSIHDHIVKFTYYDVESRFMDSAVGAMVEPGVVCEGYAKSFKLMCDELGIPCTIVFGNFISSNNTGHVWNYVQMEDGNWYAVDTTWDDLDGADGKELKYQYFLKGADSFFVNHTEVNDFNITVLTYPELSEKDYTPAAASDTTTSTTSTTTTSKTTTSSTTTTSKTTTSSTATTSETTTASTTTTSKTTTTSITTTSKPTTTSTTAATAPPADKYDKCDLNRDGEVNAADLVVCAKAVMGEEIPEYPWDVNEDERTDIFDLVFMRKIIAKIISK